MIVGILKEIKPEENRVAMTPSGAAQMVQAGHTVLIEIEAGRGSGFTDKEYVQAGAELVVEPAEIYKRAEMVMHVKEPLPSEYDLIRPGQIVFTFLHLAANEKLTHALINAGSVNIAYETIQRTDGSLPLLIPMSEVAGRMAVQQAAKYLEMTFGGRGVLLGGVPGVAPATVLIIGDGVVGTQAAKMACGLGARVYLMDKSLPRLRQLDDILPANCFLLAADPEALARLLSEADAVIGAVLIPGAKAPRLVTRAMLKTMKPGSVLVDVAIDQGGCFETSRPTTHADPIYTVDGIIHYAVANIPGAVAKTATRALTNATLPYALELAGNGWQAALRANPELQAGANIIQGKVTCPAVAQTFGLPHTPVEKLL